MEYDLKYLLHYTRVLVPPYCVTSNPVSVYISIYGSGNMIAKVILFAHFYHSSYYIIVDIEVLLHFVQIFHLLLAYIFPYFCP